MLSQAPGPMPVMAQYGVFGFQLGVASLAVHQSHVQRGKVQRQARGA
jgi:hypothetical protein